MQLAQLMQMMLNADSDDADAADEDQVGSASSWCPLGGWRISQQGDLGHHRFSLVSPMPETDI